MLHNGDKTSDTPILRLVWETGELDIGCEALDRGADNHNHDASKGSALRVGFAWACVVANPAVPPSKRDTFCNTTKAPFPILFAGQRQTVANLFLRSRFWSCL